MKFRRGKITSPSTANVVDIEWNENNSFDRRSADDTLTGNPVETKRQGSGSFSLVTGTVTRLYNHSMTITVEDVSVANGTETITTRTFIFTKCTCNRGMSVNNDGGESSRKVSFEFGEVTES